MKKCSLIFMAIACGFSGAYSEAQKSASDDGPVGIFASRAEYEQFMGDAKQLAYGPEASPELRAMIPLLNDIALNRPIGWTAGEYNTERSTAGMLADEEVRLDLEMVDDQYQELKELNAQIQQRMAEQIRNLDLTDTENLASRLNELREQAQRELNSLLLPHQIDRLRQIRLQNQLRHRNLIDVLCSHPLKSLLHISDSQARELRKDEKQIQEELEREIAKLREQARDRLLSRLKAGQRSELKEMLGESFEAVNLESVKDGGKSGNDRPK